MIKRADVDSATDAQTVQDAIDSSSWGGLNSVLNTIIAIEMQNGVTAPELNAFKG